MEVKTIFVGVFILGFILIAVQFIPRNESTDGSDDSILFYGDYGFQKHDFRVTKSGYYDIEVNYKAGRGKFSAALVGPSGTEDMLFEAKRGFKDSVKRPLVVGNYSISCYAQDEYSVFISNDDYRSRVGLIKLSY